MTSFDPVLLAVTVAGAVGFGHPPAPRPHEITQVAESGIVYLDDAEGSRLAQSLRDQGYHCAKAVSTEKIMSQGDGITAHRLSCGATDPTYIIVITTDGRQYVMPRPN